jgi:hypothetical protein
MAILQSTSITGSLRVTGSLNIVGGITGNSIISGSLGVTGSVGLFNKSLLIGTDVGNSPSSGFNSTWEFRTGPSTYDTELVFRPNGNAGGYNDNYWGSIRWSVFGTQGLHLLAGNYVNDIYLGTAVPGSTTVRRWVRLSSTGFRIGPSESTFSLAAAEARLHVDGATKLNGNTIITGSNSLAGSYALRVINSSNTDIVTIENNGKTSFLTPTLNGITILDTGDVKLEVSESRIGNAKSVVFKTFGATGGWKGGYDFRTGYNDSAETTSAFKIIGNSTTTNSVGIGDFALNILETADAQLVIEKNTMTTGSRNAAIRILNILSFDADDDNTYSGIQFDGFNEGIKGGAFIGTQASTYSNGYETDFVILATGVAQDSYSEIARFVGWNKSFYIGENRNIISSSYKLQVDGAVSASTYYGDGSNLTGINTGSWNGIFTGSAQITGSLTVQSSEINFINLPTSDPNIAGRLFQTSSEAIGASAGFQVVCISQG